MEPYLSVVIAAREGSESEQNRIQLFARRWIDQAKRHGLDSELIVAGAASLPINLPDDCSACNLRCVETPLEANVAKARNTAIRQAGGQFILATNPDVLFSDELVQFLASRHLQGDRFYRADVFEVASLPSGIGADQELAYCRAHSARIHAREGTFALTSDGLRRTASGDITPVDSGINFGDGWFPPEKCTASAATFRWIDNDAEILVRVPTGGGIMLLDFEPGPGLAALPQMLQVVDDSGRTVAAREVMDRATIALAVPARDSAALQSFRLRVTGGGRPILDDDRILNLAVFRCDWVEPNPPLAKEPSLFESLQRHKPTLGRLLGSCRKAGGIFPAMTRGPIAALRAARLLSRRGRDIFEAGMDFQLGPGWFYLEETGGERFRWISRDAAFFLRLPGSTSRIAMLIEPGPNQGDRPLQLVVRDENQSGAILARYPVAGLTYLEFTVPAAPGSITALHFTSEGSIEQAGQDTRPLSYRILACGAGAREIRRPALAKHWPVLPLDSKPATKDWIASLEQVKRELDEMGHPEHLHTNAASHFLLMSRAAWLDVRGFPEIGMTPEYLDALLCYAAHHCGLREEVLCEAMRVYCIGDTGPTSQTYAMPLSVQREDLMWLIAQMRGLHAPVIFNGEDWGR